MKYEIYIDESGTINQFRKGIFEVAFLLIKKDKSKKTKNFYNKKILKFKNENEIQNDIELKAHYLKENNFLDFIDNIFHSFLINNRVISAFVDNRDLSSSFNNADQRFFDMISFIIERCKDRGYLSIGDEVEIFADQRNNLVGEIKRLQRRVDNIHDIKITKFSFLDSKSHTLIQIADIVSFKCNRIIIESLKRGLSTPSIPNLSFRKIFY